MLPKAKRLSRIQFIEVKRRGIISSSQTFTILSLRTLKESRVSVVISTKVHKLAVTRNRIRRKIYRLFLQNKLRSTDLIIYPKKTILNLDDEKISSEINSLVSKISFA